jgi:hypothetical protein
VLAAGRLAWPLVVVDLPRRVDRRWTLRSRRRRCCWRWAAARAPGLRRVRAALDGWETAGRDRWSAGAVVSGAQSRASLSPREARATLVERLWALIPADTVELAAAEDGVLLLDRPDLSAVHAMLALANRIVPFPEQTG